MSAQSVGILPNNEVALFCVPCYTIGMSEFGWRDGSAGRTSGFITTSGRRSKAKTTPKPIII